MAKRKLQARFSHSDDVKLLLEVADVNPFANRGKWGEIAEKVNVAVNRETFTIDSTRARERTQLLLDKEKKKKTKETIDGLGFFTFAEVM